ncbi:MAG: methyltransferase type 12 [Roseateles depolymerans]|uniref:Methyltransferase type 12 n=1 Tax=Roseateles depolymerans TaxID=76731 RepID=A0A2W5FZF9_9BURK|nr:MAG: methyltransferase type 12 [Roseateles depolymerans]
MNRLRWPWSALLAWLAAWLLFALLRRLSLDLAWAAGGATLLGAGLAALHGARWRRLIVALGFPASLLAQGWQAGAATWLPWLWWLPLLLLWWLYPRRSWTEAPLFPTSPGALAGLASLAPLRAGQSALDAGCGLGDGLLELARVYPGVRLHGVEWSRPLAWLARWRLRGQAEVSRGDLWAGDWSGYDLVYVFQRPESMPRVWAKAQAEMRPGGWLASLDFEVPGQKPAARWQAPGGRPVWLYHPRGRG